MAAAGTWFPPCPLCIHVRSNTTFSAGLGHKETGVVSRVTFHASKRVALQPVRVDGHPALAVS